MTLLIMYALGLASMIGEDARSAQESQLLFDRLVSAADYSVKVGLAMRSDDGSARYPNWIAGEPSASYVEDIREREGLRDLYISLEEPEIGDHDTCIYRLIVVGSARDISRLHVCGG